LNFLIENWMLLSIALASGSLLLWPVLQGAATDGINPTEAIFKVNREKAVFIDVCSEQEYAAAHIKGARHVPLEQLNDKLNSIVRNKNLPVILVCASGNRSKRAVAIAQKIGYSQAYSLAGGLKAWKAANLPVENT